MPKLNNLFKKSILETFLKFLPVFILTFIFFGTKIVANASGNGEIGVEEINIFGINFGEIDLTQASLPFLTFVIALLDGFNPCAMWVLVFLITILLDVKETWKRWLFGGVFIFISGAAYLGFLYFWKSVNSVLLSTFAIPMQIIIGLIALIYGYLTIKDYFENKEIVCEIGTNNNRKKIFDRIKGIIQKKSIIISLIGIIFLALSINIVELICSAALPAAYTAVLSQAGLPWWGVFGYLLFYALIFMIDDIIVFSIAMFTLNITSINNKFNRYIKLIGGIVMILLGLWLFWDINF